MTEAHYNSYLQKRNWNHIFFSNHCRPISLSDDYFYMITWEKLVSGNSGGKSLLISSRAAFRQKPATCADTLQCVKQWRPKRTQCAAEKWHPDFLINARGVDFELCSNCCILRSGRFSSVGLIPSKACVIAEGWRARGLIRWPCGLTITGALSCLSRPLSGSGVTEQQ